MPAAKRYPPEARIFAAAGSQTCSITHAQIDNVARKLRWNPEKDAAAMKHLTLNELKFIDCAGKILASEEYINDAEIPIHLVLAAAMAVVLHLTDGPDATCRTAEAEKLDMREFFPRQLPQTCHWYSMVSHTKDLASEGEVEDLGISDDYPSTNL
jgi:hypothetical protein